MLDLFVGRRQQIERIMTRAVGQVANGNPIAVFVEGEYGIASLPTFSRFLKGMWESNATSPKRIPLLLMLCGTRERRFEMQRQHEPVERMFDLIEKESAT